MRKRSTQEILEVLGVYGDPDLKKRQDEVAAQRKKDQNKKPDLTTQKARESEARTEYIKAKRDAVVAKTEKEKRDSDFETKQARVSSKEKFASSIAGKKPSLERITSKDKSVSATGKAAMNLAKSATSIGRKVASIPTRMAARKDKQDLGKEQIKRGQAPTAGTTGQKVKYAAKPVTRAVSNAARSIRRTTGRGVEKVGKRIIPEDFIHEAEKGDKQIKKEKIDVMKGTNKIEVNPKSLPEAKKMTKSQIEKRDEIADAISTREMNKRYGDKNVKYAIATKLAMKKKKKNKKKIDEAKEEGGYISNLAKAQVRNKRRFGKEGSTEARGYFGQKDSEAAELSKKRTDEHKARRGVKNESVSGIEVQNVSDGIKFREYEFIDVVKPEPMRSPKNNITWTEEKAPVGLMKLAATVAANNKKRKNALQIQKYIGEETPDAISGKDLKRISELSGKKTRFGDGPEGTAKRKAALEKKRGMKLDDHPQFKTEGKGSNPNKRYIGDPIVTSKKSFTQTGKIGIDYYTDDEKKKSEKEKIKDAKDPKKNKSRERATQNMQMLKRMTPEQKYARKMRIKQQQKDKK